MKVAIGHCFSLSDEAVKRCLKSGMSATVYAEEGCVDPTADFVLEDKEDILPMLGSYEPVIHYDDPHDEKRFRSHPVVIQVVEELGDKASVPVSQIQIIEIPFENFEGWYICVTDEGWESIHEEHRVWEME